MATSGIPIGEWSGSDAVQALHRSIEEHQRTTARQTTHSIVLTWVMAGLTLVMTIGLGIQIWLALPAAH